MKRVRLIFLFSFLPIFLSAQDSFIISLKNEKFSSSLAQYYCKDLILAQEEDSCLGVITPAYNRFPTPIYLQAGLRHELSDWLTSIMPQGQGLNPLTIKINRIYLYDLRSGGKHYECLDLSISFLTIADTVLSEQFTANASISELVYYEEVTILSLLKKGFTDCFSQFSGRIQSGLIVPHKVDPVAARENVLNITSHIGCFTDTVREKGIYKTFYDFRDNRPDTTYQFTIHPDYNEDNPELTHTWLKFRGESPPKNIWGFCDGEADYIKVGSSYCRLTRDSILFYTYTRSREYGEDIAVSAVFGGVFFGVVGAALFGGLTAAATPSKYIIKTKVDMFYGKLVPFESPGYPKISSTLVLYCSKVSLPDVTIQVYEDEKLQCTLTPDSYLALDYSSKHPVAKIKLVASNGISYQKEIPLKLTRTSVFLLKLKKNEAMQFNQLHDQMKTDMLKNMSEKKSLCKVDIR